uniref:Uncharacterized protein n=1 Tax=Aegilops tauschii subsp. strangulata TaxID=200361 RepID=A0A453HVN7_AEGTS
IRCLIAEGYWLLPLSSSAIFPATMVPIPLLIARFRLPSLSLSQERSLAAHRPFLTVPWHLSVGERHCHFLPSVPYFLF